MASFVKGPTEVKDYGFDWSDHLAGGDTVASSSWTVPDGITEPAEPTTADTDTITTIWLSGGTDGEDYEVTCHVVTAQGREFERTLEVLVRRQ